MTDPSSAPTHSDPVRPVFGYDGGDSFYRAMDAKKCAEWRAEAAAERIAEFVLAEHTTSPGRSTCPKPDASDIHRYAKAKAGRQYAAAVYEVEAAKVRAA